MESLKLQDTNYLKESEDKWRTNESKIEAVNHTLDELLRKLKHHDVEILHLSDNVFDYSFKEMAASFDERVENRLQSVKQQIQEITKNLSNLSKVKEEDGPFTRVTEKIQKMVNNRLDCYTDGVDQKLIGLAQSNGANTQVPTETLDGKKILYQCGKKIINPDKVMRSVDGTLRIKKKERVNQGPTTSKNNSIVSKKRLEESQGSSEHEDPQKKRSNFDRLKTVREKNKKKMSERPKERKEETIESYGNIYFKGSNSMQQPGSFCKFGEKCWNRDCERTHQKSPGGENFLKTDTQQISQLHQAPHFEIFLSYYGTGHRNHGFYPQSPGYRPSPNFLFPSVISPSMGVVPNLLNYQD